MRKASQEEDAVEDIPLVAGMEKAKSYANGELSSARDASERSYIPHWVSRDVPESVSMALR
jgi:hypothetical protein